MKYKFIITILIVFGTHIILEAQSLHWDWVKNAGGGTTDQSYSICTDPTGFVYITGAFESDTITFDSIQLINKGSKDIFLAKYNSKGNVIWAKSAGGDSGDIGSSVASDGFGNVFVTGHFDSDSISFGQATLFHSNTSDRDMYIVKYDSDGTVLWAKNGTSTVTSTGHGLCTDAIGNVYVTGEVNGGSITFDFGTITTSNLFIVKFDPDGNAIWGKGSSSANSYVASGNSIEVDATGNIYVTGEFIDTVSFDTHTLTAFPFLSIFTLKLDSSGNVIWAKGSEGGNFFGGAYSTLALDRNDNLYVTGTFTTDTIIFDNTILINAGGSDFFILKYDASGDILWAKSNGSNQYENSYCITTDSFGNSYVSGSYSSDSLNFGTSQLISSGSYDGFIAKYDANGNSEWAKSVGGEDGESTRGIAQDEIGNLYTTGFYASNPSLFDSISINTQGYGDVFISKLSTITTSIEEQWNPAEFNIYPNPFSDYTVFEFENQKNEKHNLSIYDLQGRLVHTINNITTEQLEIKRNNLRSGHYFFQLRTARQVRATGKLIVD